jgi:hypothetical protein
MAALAKVDEKRMKSRRRAIGAAFLLLVMASSPARAYSGYYPNSPCNTGRAEDWQTSSHYHNQWVNHLDSYWTGNLNPRAIQSTLDEFPTYNPAINRWSLGNVMITNTSGGIQRYAQIGWVRSWGGGRVINVTWTDAYGTEYTDRLTPLAYDPEPFQVTWTNAPGNGIHTFNFYEHYLLRDTIQTNWSPNEALALAEVFGSSSQMPGDSGMHMRYQGTLVAVNASWLNMGTAGNDAYRTQDGPSGWYGNSAPSSTEFNTWDAYC